MRLLEVIANNVEDARQAEQGGATSLELVQRLDLGGLTPPLEIVRAIRDAIKIHLRAIVRPHAESFVYSMNDVAQMLQDIEAFKQMGVEGIVFGALLPNETVDLDLTRQIALAAAPMEITFHRAIDVCKDADFALPQLKGLAHRILTSGQQDTVWDGREKLRSWISQYSEDFLIACGGGIKLNNLEETVRATLAKEYHVGTSAQTNGVVDSKKVQQIHEIINSI
jgi:copper homeostasis protein